MKNGFLLLFAFQLNIIYIQAQKILSLKLKQLMDAIFISIPVGMPYTNMFEVLNQELQFSWTISRFFNIDISTSSKYLGQGTIAFNGKSVNVSDYQDIVTFPNTNITSPIHFKFSSTVDEVSIFAGGFAFPHIYTDERYSLVHQLKKDGLIGNLAYSIVFDKEGLLYLGGIPSAVISHKKHGTCKVRLDNPRWGCDLIQVYLAKHNQSPPASLRYDNHYDSYFLAIDKGINVPIDFIEFLVRNDLKPHIDNEDCFYTNKTNIHLLECRVKIIDDLPDIVFAFPTMTITLPLHKLFYRYSAICRSYLRNDEDLGNNWIFGSYILSYFYGLFDYENHSITFYATEGISSTEKSDEVIMKQIHKGWPLTVITLSLLGCVWLVLTKIAHLNKNTILIS